MYLLLSTLCIIYYLVALWEGKAICGVMYSMIPLDLPIPRSLFPPLFLYYYYCMYACMHAYSLTHSLVISLRQTHDDRIAHLLLSNLHACILTPRVLAIIHPDSGNST